MTYRLTPVGSCGAAEAFFGGKLVQIIVDDVVGDVARRRGEVAALPETLSPVAFGAAVLKDMSSSAASANLVADKDWSTVHPGSPNSQATSFKSADDPTSHRFL